MGYMINDNLQSIGSETAKAGFKNENDIINKFNNWKKDDEAKAWLAIMKYDLKDIEYVKAEKVRGQFKADIQVQVCIKLKKLISLENIQVKLVRMKRGKNQIDKRWVDKYVELWKISKKVEIILKRFSGEIKPTIKNPRDKRRMFLDEFDKIDQRELIKFFQKNKILIVNDILRGRDRFSAEWMLVSHNYNNKSKWILKHINDVIQFFSDGEIKLSPRKSLYIGKILMQRKGGDGGRASANMLQFNIDPLKLFDIE